MEALIRPEIGLMFWTITCFVLLALVLSRTAWRPLIAAVEEREHALKTDRHAAETARAQAEKIKVEMAAQLAAMKDEVRRLIDKVGIEQVVADLRARGEI